MILPTGRAILVFALLAPLALLGWLTPLAGDLLLVLDAALVVAVVADGTLAVPPHRLALDRVAPPAFAVGAPATVMVRVGNPTGRTARVGLTESQPDVLGPGPAPVSFTIPPGERVTRDREVIPVRRGRTTGGDVWVRTTGPLGLGWRQRRIVVVWPVLVFPPVPGARGSGAVAGIPRRRDPGRHRARRPGEGSQFESLREWVPGDDIRSIDWKATARRRAVITKQYEAERRQQVMIAIDCGRGLAAEADGVARIDHAVAAALRLALAALRQDDDVGLMLFADEVRAYLAPRRGRRVIRQVAEMLAQADSSLVESDYPRAFRELATRNRKRALTVIFTDVIDRFASEALVTHVSTARSRHLSLVVTLRDEALHAAAVSRPATAPDAWRKAGAEELIRAREDALNLMRLRGAEVLDVAPAEAGPAAVSRYLELKRRGRL